VEQTLRRELPNFMHPREIVVLDSLPRNANGKIDRVVLERGEE
jgi:acyl-coenzyme A synthetase/AMP-(fatty) acid ligase